MEFEVDKKMSNEIILKEQSHVAYIESKKEVIVKMLGLQDATPQDLDVAFTQFKRTGLDPVTRQIYAIVNNGKLSIMASIDGLRLIAERSGAYEGQTAPQWCGDDGLWKDVWLSKDTPKACRIGVYKTKFREPLYAIALFDEYSGRYAYDDKYGKYKKGDLTYMWSKMPALMIAKVAEALALRKAFPNEMSGIYSDEEMQQANNQQQKDVTNTTNNVSNTNNECLDFDSYTIELGPKNKMTGTKLKDHTPEWLQKNIDSQVKWHKENNKSYHQNTSDFLEHASAYLESLKK